ncbi:D-alanyl-D-alanine carboxypeptidase family protein [Prosthecobacter sp.]|uniref:D-alanyl-D-alanine carboxypeptidase family protein n=1 Tax=Prosthecobacter sp. TaxID=1965333 RepID=UPI00378499F5
MRLIPILMTAAACVSLSSCADFGVVKAIPVAPNSQHLYAEGDSAQVMPVLLPESPMLVATTGPSIRAASYLLLDARTGQHLAGRSFETARAVASTQKLVTALVVLDAGNLDKMVRVQASDVAVEPTRLGLKPGEVYSRRTLLYAFLVKSANDVANVLARDNAGSISAFAAKMNAKVRSLGCTNSNFKNPHGLTVGGQYSTARDMARVAMACYRNGIIRDVVRRKYYTFRRADGRMVTLENTNELLGVMPECNGMKTGYTVASGRCLISSAASGSREVILVQLGTKTKYIWEDARIMMSWGLQRLRSRGGVALAWMGN